jgi:hypothetical protein
MLRCWSRDVLLWGQGWGPCWVLGGPGGGHAGSVNGLAFPPRAPRGPAGILPAGPAGPGPGLLASAGSDGSVRLWSRDAAADARGAASGGAAPWRECGRGDAGAEAVCVAFSPCGRHLLAGSLAGALAVWHVLPHEPARLPHTGPPPATGRPVDAAGRLRLAGLGRGHRRGVLCVATCSASGSGLLSGSGPSGSGLAGAAAEYVGATGSEDKSVVLWACGPGTGPGPPHARASADVGSGSGAGGHGPVGVLTDQGSCADADGPGRPDDKGPCRVVRRLRGPKAPVVAVAFSGPAGDASRCQ